MPNKTILIYAVDEGIRESLKNILANHFNLIITENATSCQHTLEQQINFSMAFIGVGEDLNNDKTIIQTIRKNHPLLTIIALADHRQENAGIKAVTKGATGYMVKPFKANEILACIK